MVGCFLWEVGRRENRTITNNKHNQNPTSAHTYLSVVQCLYEGDKENHSCMACERLQFTVSEFTCTCDLRVGIKTRRGEGERRGWRVG